jgi:hypothetical protein
MAAGRPYGNTPYGTETMHLLRAEKGYPIVGQDTGGTVTPHDLGMAWAVSKKEPDFIGKRSFSQSENQNPPRKQLVGLLPVDGATRLPEGSQIVEFCEDDMLPPPPVPMLDHVTSSYRIAELSGGTTRCRASDQGVHLRQKCWHHGDLAGSRRVAGDPALTGPELEARLAGPSPPARRRRYGRVRAGDHFAAAGFAQSRLIGQACALDLHPRAFGAGAAAESMLGRAGVIVLAVDGRGGDYRILLRFSFARYLVDWLLDAVASTHRANRDLMYPDGQLTCQHQ